MEVKAETSTVMMVASTKVKVCRTKKCFLLNDIIFQKEGQIRRKRSRFLASFTSPIGESRLASFHLMNLLFCTAAAKQRRKQLAACNTIYLDKEKREKWNPRNYFYLLPSFVPLGTKSKSQAKWNSSSKDDMRQLSYLGKTQSIYDLGAYSPATDSKQY